MMSQVQILESASRVVALPQMSAFPYKLVLAYIVLEFGRPQEVIPGLAALHLPGIAIGLLAFQVMRSGRFSFSDRQSVLLSVLLVLLILHVPLVTNTFYAFNITWSMTLQLIVYCGIIVFVDSMERIKTICTVLLGVHVYLALHALVLHGRGVGGFLGDENDLCMTLDMMVPVPFFLALCEKNTARRLWYFVATGMLIIGIVATSSRGGFLGLLAVGVYCWIRSPRKVAALGVIGVLVGAMLIFTPQSYWDEMSTITKGTENETGEDRVYQWEIGWEMFLDNPVIGVGQGNFPFEFRTYEIKAGYPEGLHGRSRAGRAAHSLYFTLMPELGLVGIYIFLSLLNQSRRELVTIRRSLIPAEESSEEEEHDVIRNLTFALEGSFVGFLASSVFITTLYYPNYWILVAIVLALRKVVVGETT